MTRRSNLGDLISAEGPTITWPSDWAPTIRQLVTTTSAGLGQPTNLDSASIEEVLTCPGWWVGQREVDEIGGIPGGLQLHLSRRVARSWLAENLTSAPSVRPLTFAGQALERIARTEGIVGRSLRNMSAAALTELRSELAMMLATLDADWPNRVELEHFLPSGVSTRTRLGRVTLNSDLVDATVGQARQSGDVIEAGATLVSLTLSAPTLTRLEGLGISALLHGLRTGCPPARIVSWNLSTGTGIAGTVDESFVAMWLGRVCEATRRISEIQSWFEPRLHGGEHCQICPMFDMCPSADRSEYAW